LGLLREDSAVTMRFLGRGNIQEGIRAEIEAQITRRERISTSVDVPLTEECERVLNFAAEEAERLGHRHVGTEHLLLGLLRVETSLAARLLQAKGFKAMAVREQLARASRSSVVSVRGEAKLKLASFLAGLKCSNSEELIEFFAEKAQFIDVFGKRWNRGEILKGFETLFAPYAKKSATALVEETLADVGDLFVASVLWKNAILANQERIWIHRMHVTPVQPL